MSDNGVWEPGVRIGGLMTERGLNATQLGASVGVLEATAKAWASGRQIPRSDYIYPVADTLKGDWTVEQAIIYILCGRKPSRRRQKAASA